MNKKIKKFKTRIIHESQSPEELFGSVSHPIYLTSTFRQKEFAEYIYDYSRAGNPTKTNLEKNITSLEEGVGSVVFASGMAAISAIIHLFSSGDEIIFTRNVYGGTYRVMENLYKKFSIISHWVDTTDLNAIRQKINKNTRMIFVETPTNPMMEVCDIKEISKIAQKSKCLLAVDNTFMSPYNQRPLTLGADIVIHSITKYLNGHSDVIGGIVITNNKKIVEDLEFIQMSVGAVLSPFDCWITQRSLKTLAVRMKAHNKNAFEISEFLQSSKKIKKIYYPGLKTHFNYQVAKQQQIDPNGKSVFGGMLSIDLGNLSKAKKFVKNLKLFILAESLGGVESLVCHPATMTHASVPKKIREKIGVTDGLIRLSVGIEDVQDLIDDLKTGLSKI